MIVLRTAHVSKQYAGNAQSRAGQSWGDFYILKGLGVKIYETFNAHFI